MINKRGQVTIFIIIAIVIVVAVVGYFALRGNLFTGGLPANMQPIEETLKSCLENYVMAGADVLGSQGGYIYLPDFEPGSSYMPFSSQLEFMGSAIPYWYYVSGNNIQKEQVPSKSDMENQLEQFVEEKVRNCVFDSYHEQGFEIVLGEPKASAIIGGSDIQLVLNMNMEITKGDTLKGTSDVGKVKKHSVEVNSKLGKLYDSAKKIYAYEQKNLFLEEYAVDTLRLYAPVDGVEISCSPKTWIAEEVFDELQEGIEANTMALKTEGKSDDYFVVDVDVGEDVRFLNSRDWTYNVEVDNDGAVLISNPVGNQPGLGILGFCYVPYHYVYNLGYPVLAQVSDGDELFQFPMAVVVRGNKPREALKASAVDLGIPELCKYKNTLIDVDVRDSWGDNVDAQISFECSGTKCNIGETENGNLKAEFPQCVNGYVLARAEGYQDAKYLYPEITSGSVNILMNKVYDVDVDLKLDGQNFGKTAMVSFVSDRGSSSIVYPEQKTVKLAEGDYEISVYIYDEGNIELGSLVTEQCTDIPRSGIGGILGFTKKKCFDVEIPEQIISNLLVGGGKQNYYLLESELETSNVVEIDSTSLEKPKTIDDLQTNYIVFDSKGLEVYFR